MITSSSQVGKKTFSDTEDALSEVSKLLSRLCKSRKAPSKLREITELTGVVARLSRSLYLHGVDGDGHDGDGYGTGVDFPPLSERKKVNNLIR